MLRRVDLRGRELSKAQYQAELPRATLDVAAAMLTIEPILQRVKSGNESDLLELAEKFDGVRPQSIRVPQAALDNALSQLDPAVRAALELSAERIRKVHASQVRRESTVTVVDGGTVREKWIPVDRVGLYVPGGVYVYPSSVIMNVVPAQIAGVESLVVCSPPQKDFGGWPHPTILAACALLGVTEVYAAGGSQAIALLAYGATDIEIEPVYLVTGPGNMYVTAAKRMLKGLIGIDSEAGPTEIAILADDSANPDFVAADLISQAEHDEVAASVLVTDSEELIKNVRASLERLVPLTMNKDRIRIALTGQQSAFVLVDDLDHGLKVVDAYAAEHLEIHTRNASEVARRVNNAGAIFVGDWSPVSLGDYAAGSNHVLPTGGCACHSSGLSVQSFLRGVHYVEYNETALSDIAQTVITLANSEGLPGHAAAIEIRAK
jgi:histidinol dehydrogenase